MSESPIEQLERWANHGGLWRVATLSASEAVVELRSCDGELIDELRSEDGELLRHLAHQPSSDSALSAGHAAATRWSVEVGKASFPASDPPSSWTWEVEDRPTSGRPRLR